MEVSSVQDKSHSGSILQCMYNMFKEERLCDITLVINNRKFRAHRLVLASMPYFDAMFRFNNFSEGNQDEVPLRDISEAAFTALLKFAYTGRIDITPQNVQELLHGANYFAVEFVQKSCSDFLKDSLDEKNCLGIFQLAERLSIEDLRSAAMRYCLQHFSEVSQEEEFLDFPLPYMLEVLQADQLFVTVSGIVPTMKDRERFVLEAVFRYVEHDLENRKAGLPALLARVRLPWLTLPSLEALRHHELVKDSKESLEVVDRAITRSDTNGLDCRWSKPRKLDCSVWKGTIHGSYGFVQDILTFNDEELVSSDVESEVFVSGMKVWIVEWGDIPVVGGIQVFYSNGIDVVHGGESGTEHEFHIDEDERITKVNVYAPLLIKRLLFYTNKHEDGEFKNYGPYGVPRGCESLMEVPPGSHSYLAWVKGSFGQDRSIYDYYGLTTLQFVWRTFGRESESDEDSSEFGEESELDEDSSEFGEESELDEDSSEFGEESE